MKLPKEKFNKIKNYGFRWSFKTNSVITLGLMSNGFDTCGGSRLVLWEYPDINGLNHSAYGICNHFINKGLVRIK
jgi:hypothetical protein